MKKNFLFLAVKENSFVKKKFKNYNEVEKEKKTYNL